MMNLARRAETTGKRLAKGLVGAVSPRLLRSIQLARARSYYLHEPTRGPRRVLLEPTTGCGHHCQMCPEHSPWLSQPTPTRSIPFPQVESLLRDLASLEVEEVWLAGRGEPLAHPQAIEIFELIGTLGMQSTLTTNGQRLTEARLDRLCDSQQVRDSSGARAGLAQLSVSIDSGRPETYAFIHDAPAADRARILSLIKRASQRQGPKPKLLVSMVLTKPNSGEIMEFARDGIAAGVNGLVIAGMRPVPFDSGELALTETEWPRVRADLAEVRELATRAGVEVVTDNIPHDTVGQQLAAVLAPGAGASSCRTGAGRAPLGGTPEWPYSKMACFIGHLFAVVDVNGYVHGCCTCQNKLGWLGEASFREVWHSRPYRQFRRILREMPSTGLTPPRCECRYGCGHIAENAAVQGELGLQFARRRGESEYATRLEVARAIWRHLGPVLPRREESVEFADLDHADVDEETRREVARLGGLGVFAGTGSLGSRPLFDPSRLLAWEELEEVTRRALRASGSAEDAAARQVKAARQRSGPAPEPIKRIALEAWLREVAGAAAVGPPSAG